MNMNKKIMYYVEIPLLIVGGIIPIAIILCYCEPDTDNYKNHYVDYDGDVMFF